MSVGFATTPSVIGHIKSGKMRGLAVTTAQRSPSTPDLPTIGETVAGYETNSWGGVIAPAKLPGEILNRLVLEIKKALASSAVAERYKALDTETDGAGPEAFLDLVRSETPKWADVVRRSGAKVD